MPLDSSETHAWQLRIETNSGRPDAARRRPPSLALRGVVSDGETVAQRDARGDRQFRYSHTRPCRPVLVVERPDARPRLTRRCRRSASDINAAGQVNGSMET